MCRDALQLGKHFIDLFPTSADIHLVISCICYLYAFHRILIFLLYLAQLLLFSIAKNFCLLFIYWLISTRAHYSAMEWLKYNSGGLYYNTPLIYLLLCSKYPWFGFWRFSAPWVLKFNTQKPSQGPRIAQALRTCWLRVSSRVVTTIPGFCCSSQNFHIL